MDKIFTLLRKIIIISLRNVEIELNHSGVQGALYTLDDLGVKNYTIKEKIDNSREGYFFKY